MHFGWLVLVSSRHCRDYSLGY